MTFTLKLIFTGLVTFVPIMDDPQDPTKLTAVWVLMVNAEDTVPFCKVDPSSTTLLHSHFPLMVFNNKFTGSPLSRDFPVPLEDTDVRLDIATGGLPTSEPCFKSSDHGDIRRSGTLPAGARSETPGADPCEASDFSWVAETAKFSNFARVCKHCLDDIVNSGDSLEEVPGDRIKARIKLTRGFLETAALTRRQSDLKLAVFEASNYKQVLAEEVTLKLVDVEDQVTFELCDFLLDPKCSKKEMIVLKPLQPNDTITVQFCNETTSGACGRTGSPMDPENDHFLYFYKLSGDVTLPGDEEATCGGEIVIPRPRKGDFGDPRCPDNQMLPPL